MHEAPLWNVRKHEIRKQGQHLIFHLTLFLIFSDSNHVNLWEIGFSSKPSLSGISLSDISFHLFDVKATKKCGVFYTKMAIF